MQEALQASQDFASEFSQQEINNEHFLLALLAQSEGVARPLLEKLGVSVSALEGRLRDALESRPKVRGAQVFFGNELSAVVDAAEKEMAKLKDEFLSAEHYLLALTDSKVLAGRILKDSGVTQAETFAGAAAGARLAARDRPEPRGKIPDAGKIWPRSDRRWRARERSIR